MALENNTQYPTTTHNGTICETSNEIFCLGFEILTAVKMSILLLSVVRQHRLVGGYQRLRGTYRLYL